MAAEACGTIPVAATFPTLPNVPERLAVILQLNPPLPMVTPKGDGWAHFLIDYGPESALFWVVFMDDDGACWTVPNPEVRIYKNWTLGRQRPEDAKIPREQPAAAVASAAAASPSPPRFRPSLAHPSDG